MRVLLFSDIHANLEALEACVAAAPRHDLMVNLGDVVGYGASPNEALEYSRKHSRAIVRGNHDKACSGLMDLHEFNPVAAAAAMWTQEQLAPSATEWLRTLPAGPLEMPQFPAGNGTSDTATSAIMDHDAKPAQRALLVHGSPLDEDEYLITMGEALDVLMRSSIRLTFFGHTHVQGGFTLAPTAGGQPFRPAYDSRDAAGSATIHLDPATRYLINPGSIGQPRDGDWRAAFALYDEAAGSVTFHRVPYDIKKAQQRILAAGLPPRLATRLQEGR